MTVPTELDLEFRDAAARSGLLDAGYDIVESPVGELLVAASDRGLLRISFDANVEEHLEWLSRVAGRAVLRAPRQVEAARRELDEYFAGTRQAFDLGVDLRDVTPFTQRVLAELARIPFGQTATYAELAARAGKSTSRPRSRDDDEPEPDSDRSSLPPRDRGEREPRRLCRRAGAQGGAADARGRAPVTMTA